MIQVDRLTKHYGSYKAVDGITFSIGRGEIVGLLGPNGAGKTTTMRMLTTYLSPTSGRASLAGMDVIDSPLEVRRKVGYLPENVPLYLEMRVREYLTFRARLTDVPRSKRRSSINHVIARCRLEDVESRILGQLSRGFRQRVGLAAAMVHDPDILILDEPTSGLDPIQIREVRALIRELGDRHTVLLSTHILSEVEAVCGRAIIIAQGHLAVDEPLDRLQSESLIILQARGPADAIKRALESLPGVERARSTTQDDQVSTFEIKTTEGADLREELAGRVCQNGWALRQLEIRRSTLEDRFIQAVTQETMKAQSELEAV